MKTLQTRCVRCCAATPSVFKSGQDADEHELLRDDANHQGDSQSHERRTAPIVTRGALAFPGMRELFPQRGLLGQTVAVGCVVDLSL